MKENGDVIAGQSEISHPSPTSGVPPRSITPIPVQSTLRIPLSPSQSGRTSAFPSRPTTPALFEARTLGDEDDEDDDSLPLELKNRNIVFTKGHDEVPLEARIKRIFYLNAYGTEIFPKANPLFIESLASSATSVKNHALLSKQYVSLWLITASLPSLVYSCGSLYTSILPCLALRSVGHAIARSPCLQAKILLLNSVLDRETPSYTASDFVEAIRSTCSASYSDDGFAETWQVRDLITHVVYIEGSGVVVDTDELRVCVLPMLPQSWMLTSYTANLHSGRGSFRSNVCLRLVCLTKTWLVKRYTKSLLCNAQPRLSSRQLGVRRHLAFFLCAPLCKRA